MNGLAARTWILEPPTGSSGLTWETASLEAYSQKHSQHCKLKTTHPTGAVTYVVDKSRISLRFMAPTSEQRKAQLRAQLENQITGTMMKRIHKEPAESNLGVETAEVHGQL